MLTLVLTFKLLVTNGVDLVDLYMRYTSFHIITSSAPTNAISQASKYTKIKQMRAFIHPFFVYFIRLERKPLLN
jgi:hypothetical protein